MISSVDEGRLSEFAKTVELMSTRVLEGFHRSKRGGEGVEFHSYQDYSPGEDVRRLDWKRLASTERAVVRKSDREEKAAWSILVDSSKSMSYGEKFSYSQLLAACFIYLARTWGDSWLLLPDVEKDLELAFQKLMRNDSGVDLGGEGQTGAHAEHLQILSSSKLVVISDFFFDLDRLQKLISYSRDQLRSLHLIQILDSRERAFPFSETLRFQDLESRDRLTLDCRVMRRHYDKAFQIQTEEIKSLLTEENWSFHSWNAEPRHLTAQLLQFFEDVWAS